MGGKFLRIKYSDATQGLHFAQNLSSTFGRCAAANDQYFPKQPPLFKFPCFVIAVVVVADISRLGH